MVGKYFAICFLLLSGIFDYVKAQTDFKYFNIPVKYLNGFGKHILTGNLVFETSGQNKAIDLTNLLPDRYVRDGSIDYTKYIQAGLDTYSNVVFPDFPVLINDQGLSLKSNSNIYFSSNSKIILKKSSREKYEILRLHNVENVRIINPKIQGDRNVHQGSMGEWGMGIAIRSSKNIVIVGGNITHCWGDGIYIGRLQNGISSSNIQVKNVILDFNRRNGISLVSGERISIISNLISNTQGTLPMNGIDIEPSNSHDIINEIVLDNNLTFNNASAGIVVNLRRLLSNKVKISNITIKDHIDEQSRIGFYISGIEKNNSKGMLKGKITVSGLELINNATPLNVGSNIENLQQITFEKINVVKKNSNALESVKQRTRIYPNVKFK